MEMIISVGLLALMLVVIVDSAMAISRSHDRSQRFLEMNGAAIGAFSTFSREIRKASSIDTVGSVLEASDGKVVLNMKKDDGTNDQTALFLQDEKVKESKNGALVGDLTPRDIDVSNLTFRLFQIASTTAVRVEMTVSPRDESSVPPMNFYGTYVLRGSYTE